MSQRIRIKCPGCSKQLDLPASVYGKKIKCPSCARHLQIGPGGADEPGSARSNAAVPQPPDRTSGQSPRRRPSGAAAGAKRKRRSEPKPETEEEYDVVEYVEDDEGEEYDDYEAYDDYEEYGEGDMFDDVSSSGASLPARRRSQGGGRRRRSSGRSSEGGRYVQFAYAVSIIILSFQNYSKPVFIPRGKSTLGPALPYIFVSLFFGWWGFPWGPIFTIKSLITNLKGGVEVNTR